MAPGMFHHGYQEISPGRMFSKGGVPNGSDGEGTMESKEKTVLMIFPAYSAPGAGIRVPRRSFQGRIRTWVRRRRLASGAASLLVATHPFALVMAAGTWTSWDMIGPDVSSLTTRPQYPGGGP